MAPDFHPGVPPTAAVPPTPIVSSNPPRGGIKIMAGSALMSGSALSAKVSVPSTNVKVKGTALSGQLSITN